MDRFKVVGFWKKVVVFGLVLLFGLCVGYVLESSAELVDSLGRLRERPGILSIDR